MLRPWGWWHVCVLVVFCHEAISGPQKFVPLLLYNSTLHWDALGNLGGFHVRFLSEQHDTLHHLMGEFFWKFLVYKHLVVDLKTTLWCLECTFTSYTTATGFRIFQIKKAPIFTGLSDNDQILFHLFQLFKYHPLEIPEAQAQKNIFLPKKYTSTFPHSVFSSFASHLLFLDCLTMCCSECL